MLEIECPTCEAKFSVSDSLKVGDKIECPECGELLKVVSIQPLDIDYWEEEEGGDESYEDSIDEVLELEVEREIERKLLPEDEENEDFDLPDRSSFLFGEEEEEEEDKGEEDEES